MQYFLQQDFVGAEVVAELAEHAGANEGSESKVKEMSGTTQGLYTPNWVRW